MSPDEQEALSRAYDLDCIVLRQLKSGHIAVYNRAHELCGITESPDWNIILMYWRRPSKDWFKRFITTEAKKPWPSLKDLGL